MWFITALIVLLTPLQAPETKESLDQGLQAFRQGRYPEALAAFQKAVSSDPNDVTAHLYLGRTYLAQGFPGLQSPDQTSRAAEAEFRRVLELDPDQIPALASLSSMSVRQAELLPPDLRQGRLNEAREFNLRIVQLDPLNREAHYTLGVIAREKSYSALEAARSQMGMPPDSAGPLPVESIRQALKRTYSPMIEEGISNLEAALQIDPNYDDAMAYMNLLLRARADLSDTSPAYAADIATADRWLQRALDVKWAKTALTQTAGSAIQVAANVQAGNLVFRVDPIYPSEPGVRITGTVRFSVIIGKDGTVSEITTLSGHPLLIPSALAAIQQWVYRPTLLNGEPVEVKTQVDIDFTPPTAKN